ncbi:hypothetical protein [Aureispira sp. CCB-E]|uniref:hypothetical protein n=1 Tax=Aureispira sp. CCB-E TaxID=3051121 RepID=UPI002868CB25|nr:hypothetical protein [Aureispira sp. CCB-E]WMX14728.1 hypothetical protein QP953_28120 [Aureispira sp. CCB-E]
MATEDDVEAFLDDFKAKLSVFNIVFYAREKNRETLLELEISPLERENIVKNLSVEDYSEGPLGDNNGGPDLWVFGKLVKGREVYIKVTMGAFNCSTICISFHFAEHPMNYPFN